jgi:signal peptidase I
MQTLFVLLIIYAAGIITGLAFIFRKAGRPVWAAFVPVYNLYIWLKIIHKPIWWFVFLAIPFLNLFMVMLMIVETAKTFQKFRMHEQGAAVILAAGYLPWLGLSQNEHYTHPLDLPPYKKSKSREWADAIIFAVVAALIIRGFLIEAYTIPTSSMEGSLLVGDFLFVSKYAYGPKAPNTPLTVPFTHNKLPVVGTRSYSEAISLPYYRFWGLGKPRLNDGMVFNYPSGDTVILGEEARNYYSEILFEEIRAAQTYGSAYLPGMGRENLHRKYGRNIISRPVDKRDNYIKRCLALPGDTLEIVNRAVHINGRHIPDPPDVQYRYLVHVDEQVYFQELFRRYNLTDVGPFAHGFVMHTSPAVAAIIGSGSIPGIRKVESPLMEHDPTVFPQDTNLFRWSIDNFGPLVIPAAGMTIALTPENVALYRRVIEAYENNRLEVRGDVVLINGEPAENYTFKMDYYWLMGDNRHNSLDSRTWGFVPEDHVVGKAVFVWLSLDKHKGWFSGKIRWNKVFRTVR